MGASASDDETSSQAKSADESSSAGADEAAPGEDPSTEAQPSEGGREIEAAKPRKGRKRRSWLGIAGRVLVGLVLGLGIAELGFSSRDHGAFPHLNVYVADDKLGLRLRKGATERVVVGKNPVTSVRINAQGYRGADLPPASGGETIVVGDSQVFGLGVEENETASAQLASLVGGPVINAGVPTYGPAEYNAVTKEILDQYPHAKTVVYVVNFANDLFEASHPNTTRHAEWDGWAVRKETAPDHITSFPGRELLFQKSHAFFALRAFLYSHGDQLDDRGFASEGTVSDLVGVSRAEHARAEEETRTIADKRKKEILTVSAKEVESEASLENAALDAFDLRGYELGIAYQKSRNNPGDIVVNVVHYAEESRGPPTTGQAIYNGTKVRQEMEVRIRAVAEKKVAIEEAKAAKLTLSLEQRDALKKRLDELRAAPAEIVRAWSPMAPILREVKATCDAHGARLLVVALPMDIQVSETEWAKYGTGAPVDMASTHILVDDLVSSAEALGALGLDATPALKAAEPGAFLDGDIHMTPKGQRAFAEAIFAKLL